ncbi:MAG: hypothetical protein AAF984_03065 [Verrucomicrobiota bacterium]
MTTYQALCFYAVLLSGFILWDGQCIGAQEVDPNDKPNKKNNFVEYVLSGFDKESQDDFHGAYELYTNALKIKESPTVLLRRAYCGAKIGLVEEVIQDMESAILLEPKTPTDYITVGWFRATNPFKRFRDGPLAVTLAQKSLEGRESPEAYDVLAAGYVEMKNFSRAQQVLKKAIKKFPEASRVASMKRRLELYKNKEQFLENWDRIP